MGLILRSLVTCLLVTYVHGLDISFPPNDSCILVHMNVVSFNLSYDKAMRQLSGPKLDMQKSNCTSNGTTATLALKWEDKNDTMTFTFIKGTKKVEVGVVYAFIPSEHFKESKDSNLTIMDGPAHLELSTRNMSYKCNSSQDIIFKSGIYKLVMSIAQVQIQAFDVKNGSFSKFEECDMDTLTTEAPDTTTSHKLTTVLHPTTIKPPVQSLYQYFENGSKNACILLKTAIQLDINYMDFKEEVATAKINIPKPLQVKVTGHCAKSDTGNASITLNWPYGKSTFSMKMDFIADKGEAMLEMIQVDAELSRDDFPNLHDNSTMVMSERNVDFSSSNVTYYLCNSLQEEKLDNITMVVIYKIQVQAFGVEDSKFSGKGTECSQDITSEIPTTATTPTETTANTTSQTTATTHTNTTSQTTATTHTNGTMTTSSGTTATTSASISTTASPPHHTNNYTVSDGNVTCVYFQAGMDFIFPYTTMNGTNTSTVVSVPPNFNVSGNCNQNGTTIENELSISFYTNWLLTFVFGPDNSSNQLGDGKSTTYSVKSIRLEYTMQHSLFPGYNRSETENFTTMANITGPLFQSKINGSYKCNVQSKVPFIRDIKLETYDLQYKAFNKDNKTDFGGDLTECAGDNSSDNKTNSIVPIAVGAALAGLVVIVLIAYLIGRRRNRKGYESV